MSYTVMTDYEISKDILSVRIKWWSSNIFPRTNERWEWFNVDDLLYLIASWYIKYIWISNNKLLKLQRLVRELELDYWWDWKNDIYHENTFGWKKTEKYMKLNNKLIKEISKKHSQKKYIIKINDLYVSRITKKWYYTTFDKYKSKNFNQEQCLLFQNEHKEAYIISNWIDI